MHSLVQPNSWVALKLPSGNLRILQATPNTTISLGKYGSFPSNLIIQRPFHLTYELEDRRESETFNRLRIVPASELYADILASSDSSNPTNANTPAGGADDDDGNDASNEGSKDKEVEFSLVDPESGAIVAKTNRVDIDAAATQTLSMEEIEALKKHGTNAGQDLIAKLMLSHTAIDQKTEYSLAKYKLLKTKKYIRRFSVLPLDVPLMTHWLLEEKDPSKILDMREEMIGLLGCWANVHFGGEDKCESGKVVEVVEVNKDGPDAAKGMPESSGRWLAIDDTGGLLVAAMAERMGVLFPPVKEEVVPKPKAEEKQKETTATTADVNMDDAPKQEEGPSTTQAEATDDSSKPTTGTLEEPKKLAQPRKPPFNDLQIPFPSTNTLTVIHANSQPNLSYLRYFDYDAANPPPPTIPIPQQHPLARHLLTLTWLQLLDPASDSTYSADLTSATPEEIRSWKANRRGNYHRKRRRWARVRHIVDTTRQGNFSGLVCASTMDPISIMRHTVPLLAGGAPVAIYSQSVEPLSALMDCYSIARRTAWTSNPPAELEGASQEELERWAGNEEFPLNPTLLLGASVQSSRVRKWQVLPNRTHPMMTSRGGADGFVFTAFRVKPAEGKVEARGKPRSKKRKVDDA